MPGAFAAQAPTIKPHGCGISGVRLDWLLRRHCLILHQSKAPELDLRQAQVTPSFRISGVQKGRLAHSAIMPMHWTIDSKEQLLTVVAEGDISREEFEAYLDVIDNARLHSYRKLFDGAHANTSMGPENVLALGVRMRAGHQIQPVGPLAVVVPEDKIAMVSRVLGMLAAASRPMRVFHEASTARDWIRKQPL